MKIKKIQQSIGYVGSIVDNLNTESAVDALSAQQGKILNNKIENLNIPIIEDSLTSEAANTALSAAQGKILNDTKLNKTGGTISGNLTVDGQIFASEPVYYGATRYNCVEGSYVKLFRYTMSTAWKASSVWFTIADTQNCRENALCCLYTYRDDTQISVGSFKGMHIMSVDGHIVHRLCAIVVDANNIDVYLKMSYTDSPAVSILNQLRLEKGDPSFGSTELDCNTIVSTLPEGTVTWVREMTHRPITLYNNASGTNGTVTLGETAANFSQLDITYHYSGVSKTISMRSPNGKSISLSVDLLMSAVPRTQMKVMNINGTSITTSSAGYLAIAENGSVGASSSDNNIYIINVVGYR